jgi:hypothetical protein
MKARYNMAEKFLILFAVALLVTAGLASAVPPPITQTQPFSGIPSISGSLVFDKFDTHGGTWILNSIQVTLNLETSGGEFRLDNDSTSPASGSFEFGAKGSISSTDVSLLNSSLIAIPGTVNAYHSGSFSLEPNIGDIEGDYDPSPPDGMLYNGATETDSKSGFVDDTLWAGYQGTGTYNINYEIIQWLNYGGIGGIEYAVTPVSASGYVEVIYDYYIIPEPATIVPLCTGGLILLLRKKKYN